jgi:uncharacterized radical SAM protein YgiQ
MVSNYTASYRKRKLDDLTAGGMNNRRPDRALIAYTGLIRRFYKNTAPVVLGGVEAGMRRAAHYDCWSDSVRRSVLFDAKADIIVYGMGERAVLEIARALDSGGSTENIRGTCRNGKTVPDGYTALPAYEEVTSDTSRFNEMFRVFYRNSIFEKDEGLCQKHGDRFLVQNPPAMPLSGGELDAINLYDYQREVHPVHEGQGRVRAIDTIRFTINTHRGCAGECSFCSIAVHQGRRVISRTMESVVEEARRLTKHPLFRGIITDLGGPTANMWGAGCGREGTGTACPGRSCLHPGICASFTNNHEEQIKLLEAVSSVEGVKRVFVASGLRHDLILGDKRSGRRYLERLARFHASGNLRFAPEHVNPRVLKVMGKPASETFHEFLRQMKEINKGLEKKVSLSLYFIAAHPGCGMEEMNELKTFSLKELGRLPEDVQLYTPLPSTVSSAIYHTEHDPFTGKKIFVEKNRARRELQKSIITPGPGRKK